MSVIMTPSSELNEFLGMNDDDREYRVKRYCYDKGKGASFDLKLSMTEIFSISYNYVDFKIIEEELRKTLDDFSRKGIIKRFKGDLYECQ